MYSSRKMFKPGTFEYVYNDKYKSKYESGDFSFMHDDMWRETLAHDYAAVTPEGWNALKRHNADNSFMFHTNGGIWEEIRAKMYDGHSGASMACSLRVMERIAKIGWDTHVREYIIKQERESARIKWYSRK